jgi:hypothetical protein
MLPSEEKSRERLKSQEMNLKAPELKSPKVQENVER